MFANMATYSASNVPSSGILGVDGSAFFRGCRFACWCFRTFHLVAVAVLEALFINITTAFRSIANKILEEALMIRGEVDYKFNDRVLLVSCDDRRFWPAEFATSFVVASTFLGVTT